jgi:hypothetical protein
MAPFLICLDDTTKYCLAANAPDVTASTATSAAIKVITFFKFVSLLSPRPSLGEPGGSGVQPGLLTLLSPESIALGPPNDNDTMVPVGQGDVGTARSFTPTS